jgi:hypothetical protein
MAANDFTKLTLEQLVHPLVARLRAGRRFDRPIESMLNRTEEILGNPADLAFWKSAGALGLSYRTMDDAGAADVAALMNAFADEDARLDFASAIGPSQFESSFAWIASELPAKGKTNRFPRLIELRRGSAFRTTGLEPWRVGKERAIETRGQIGLAEDQPVGGLDGLAKIFASDNAFAPSACGEDVVRGFQGRGDDVPVIIVKDEGPISTAFLMSRAIGDFLVHGSREASVANIYSDRQAEGRAFAAEFLAPARGVVNMIEEDQVPLDLVAKHYGVHREVVRRQYENNLAQYAQAA